MFSDCAVILVSLAYIALATKGSKAMYAIRALIRQPGFFSAAATVLTWVAWFALSLFVPQPAHAGTLGEVSLHSDLIAVCALIAVLAGVMAFVEWAVDMLAPRG